MALRRDPHSDLHRDLHPGLHPRPCPPPTALTPTESQRGIRLSRPHDRPRRRPRRPAASPGVEAAPSGAQGGTSVEASWAEARKAQLAAAAAAAEPRPLPPSSRSRPEHCPGVAASPRNSSTSSTSSAAAWVAGERGYYSSVRANGLTLQYFSSSSEYDAWQAGGRSPAAGSSCCR